MRIAAIVLFLFSINIAQSQADKEKGSVSYTIEFDKMRPAKDGYWFDGYLFQIDEMKTPDLKGKKIKISGSYRTITDGPLYETDKTGNKTYKQRREGNYKVVSKPKIKIITD